MIHFVVSYSGSTANDARNSILRACKGSEVRRLMNAIAA